MAVISGLVMLLVCVMFFFVFTYGKNNLEVLIHDGFPANSELPLTEHEEGIRKPHEVPCYFIFGDSLVDNGNNNRLQTLSKANYLPYGIDFLNGPTGRFSNGRTYVDFLAELLGFKSYIPPFATARGKNILSGVNYGSGGGGILDNSGDILGKVISLNEQLRNHRVTITHITNMLKSKQLAEHHLKQCFYTVGMGNNDYLVNYILPEYYNTSQLYTPDEFAIFLTEKLSNQLKALYKLGARKIGVTELGELGCLPGIMGINGSTCVGYINDCVSLFNLRLGSVINGLNANFSDANFIVLPSLGNETVPGVTIKNVPCCSVHSTGDCVPNIEPCKNRTSYYFWDGFHPTEQVCNYAAQKIYNVVSTLISKEKIRPWKVLIDDFFQ